MKLVLTLLLAGAATPAFAQDLPVHLQDGATWTITAEHIRAAEGRGAAQNWALTTTKRLTWHRGKDGKPDTLTVTPLSATPGADSPPEVAQARSLSIPATLYVDEGLTPGPVLDREAARAEVAKMVTSTSNPDPAMLDAAAKAMIASELVVTSYAQGLGFRNGVISADVALPNPLSRVPVRGRQTAALESIDAKTGRAVVRWRQSIDPEAMKESTAAMLLQMTREKIDPAKIEAFRAALASTTVVNEFECRHDIDLPTGLATQVECKMQMSVTMQGKTETSTERWRITQTLPDRH